MCVCVCLCATSLLSRLEFGARTHIRQIFRLVSLSAFSLFVSLSLSLSHRLSFSISKHVFKPSVFIGIWFIEILWVIYYMYVNQMVCLFIIVCTLRIVRGGKAIEWALVQYICVGSAQFRSLVRCIQMPSGFVSAAVFAAGYGYSVLPMRFGCIPDMTNRHQTFSSFAELLPTQGHMI